LGGFVKDKDFNKAKGYWWHFQFYLLPIIIINVSFASTKMKIKTSQANNFCFPFKYSILDAWLAGRAKKKQQQRLHQKNVNRIIGRSRQQQQWGRERDSRRDKEREGAFETHRELMFISIAGNFVNYDRQTLLPREREGCSWREREGARSWYRGKRGTLETRRQRREHVAVLFLPAPVVFYSRR